MKIFHLGLCVSPPPFNGMQKAFINNCTYYAELATGNPNVNERAIQITNELKPDIIFMQIQAANIINDITLSHMKQSGAFVMNWTGDVRNDVPQWMRDADRFVSITAFSNMRDVNALPGSEYLEIGYDPEVYRPDGETIPVMPVVFFGNHYGDQFPMSRFRLEMVNSLRGFNFGVYGNFPGANGNFNSSQLNESAAYRHAKIAINVSHYEIERYSSDRILRILGTGGAICLCKKYPSMPFEDGVHLRTWDTIPQLIALMAYYQDPRNEAERLRIAKQGREFVEQRFTFDAMCKNIISIYERRK